MSLGFDPANLAAAVRRVMAHAKERNQATIHLPDLKDERRFSLTDAREVEAYLVARTEAAYAKAGNGAVAQIRDVVYWSVGVVFEENLGEMQPPPISISGEKPIHIAHFWEML